MTDNTGKKVCSLFTTRTRVFLSAVFSDATFACLVHRANLLLHENQFLNEPHLLPSGNKPMLILQTGNRS